MNKREILDRRIQKSLHSIKCELNKNSESFKLLVGGGFGSDVLQFSSNGIVSFAIGNTPLLTKEQAILYRDILNKYINANIQDEVNEYNECIDEKLLLSKDTKEQIQVYTKIYLMVDKANYYTKIGRSKDPIFREKTLQSEKPTIELFREYKGYVEDEKKLHNHFQNKRVRGEWFDLSKEDFNYIDDYFRNKE